MNYLVGDIGNTLTKVSLLNRNFKIIKSYNIESSKMKINKYRNKYLKKIINKTINKKILFSSVVPKIFQETKSFLKKKVFKFTRLKT